MEGAIAVTALFLAVEGAAYLYAATVLRQRAVTPANQIAWWGFLAWWIGTAISSLLTVGRHVLFSFGHDAGATHITLLGAALLTSYLGTAGLLVYLFTLIQGFRKWQWFWPVLATFLFLQTMATLLVADPVRAIPAGAALGMEYAGTLNVGALGLSALPHVLLPLVLLVIIAARTRGLGDVGVRTRRLSGLLALWIITKAILTGGALGLAPDWVGWAMRFVAIVAALGLMRYAVTPSTLRAARADGHEATRSNPGS